MAVNQIVKQSNETFAIYAGISNVYQTDEQIDVDESTVTCVDVDGTDASTMLSGSPSLGSDGLKLYQRLAAGAGVEASSPYKVTFLMVTNQSNTYEKDVYVYVKDR